MKLAINHFGTDLWLGETNVIPNVGEEILIDGLSYTIKERSFRTLPDELLCTLLVVLKR